MLDELIAANSAAESAREQVASLRNCQLALPAHPVNVPAPLQPVAAPPVDAGMPEAWKDDLLRALGGLLQQQHAETVAKIDQSYGTLAERVRLLQQRISQLASSREVAPLSQPATQNAAMPAAPRTTLEAPRRNMPAEHGQRRAQSVPKTSTVSDGQATLPSPWKIHCRTKFAQSSSVELASESQTLDLLWDFRNNPRSLDGAERIYANKLLPAAEAKRAWQAREPRRYVVGARPDLMRHLTVCPRSYCLYLHREPIFYSRKGNYVFTAAWPQDVGRESLEERLGGLSASIVTVQEAHAVGLHDFAEGELPKSHKAYYSGDSAASGGILVLVHHSIFNVATVEWHEIFVGSVCALHLTHRGYLRRYIFVHFTPSQSSSWEHLLQLATQDIADDSPLTFLVGDTNVSSEVGDQITVATGEATLQYGPRAIHWKRASRDLHEIPVA
eukprot:2314497-Amphidinium_carterae.2